MKRRMTDIIVLTIIGLVVILFFTKLFWPEPHLIVTPDFGRSDAWHFSFATKYFLAQSLKKNSLPLWTSKLGGGFPLLAEGQVGAFFLPNLLAYRLFDTLTAYNLTLVLTILSLGWGTYVWLRLLKLSKVPACFGALSMAFSGPAITQLTHITLLQGMSLLPWTMVAATLLDRYKSGWWVILLAIGVSQQLLAGFPQASFITLIFTTGYYLWLIHRQKTRSLDFLRLALAVLLAAGLSAIQLLPSWEFLSYSGRPSGFLPQEADYFSYPLSHLLTLFNPYALGNPKMATYPVFTNFGGSIFWENSGFVGVLTLAAAGLFLLKARKNHWHGFFLISLLVAFLLMLGSHSPLYLIYSLWPFNLFRVPSRFIWLFVLTLVVCGSFGLQIVWNKLKKFHLAKVIFILFLSLNIYYLLRPWTDYHGFGPARAWLEPPRALAWLSPESRLTTLDSQIAYNKVFLKKGWQDLSAYFFLRNLLAPDSNLLWGTNLSEVYAGRFISRQAIFSGLVEAETKLSDNEATVSAQGVKLMSLSSTDNIFATLSLDAIGLIKGHQLIDKNQTLTQYINPASLPQAYVATKVNAATTAQEAGRRLGDSNFLLGETVLLSQALPTQSSLLKPQVKLNRPSETETIVDVFGNPTQAILVLNDTYYPGWEAWVDDKPTIIYPANITFRAIELPAGNHRIIFKFVPKSFYLGALISGLTFLGLIIGAAFLLVFGDAHTRQTASGLPLYRQRNRGR